jgi:hypothetical protein
MNQCRTTLATSQSGYAKEPAGNERVEGWLAIERERYRVARVVPRRRVVIDHSEEALAKAGRKAMKDFIYNETLKELQIELVHLQEYVKANGLKVAILFEGRDAAGKGLRAAYIMYSDEKEGCDFRQFGWEIAHRFATPSDSPRHDYLPVPMLTIRDFCFAAYQGPRGRQWALVSVKPRGVTLKAKTCFEPIC